MPLSTELLSVIRQFETLDPAKDSLNGKGERIAARKPWENWLGFFVFVITLGFCPKNRQLDQATRKVVEAVDKFFEHPPMLQKSEQQSLAGCLTKLNAIAHKNGGSGQNQKKLDQLISRVNALEVVGPMSPLSKKGRYQEVLERQLKLLLMRGIPGPEGAANVLTLLQKMETLPALTPMEEGGLIGLLIMPNWLDDAFAQMQPGMVKAIVKLALEQPKNSIIADSILTNLTRTAIHAQPQHPNVKAFVEALTTLPPQDLNGPNIAQHAHVLLHSNTCQELVKHLDEPVATRLLKGLTAWSASYEHPMAKAFELASQLSTPCRRAILEGVCYSKNFDELLRVAQDPSADPKLVRSILALHPQNEFFRDFESALASSPATYNLLTEAVFEDSSELRQSRVCERLLLDKGFKALGPLAVKGAVVAQAHLIALLFQSPPLGESDWRELIVYVHSSKTEAWQKAAERLPACLPFASLAFENIKKGLNNPEGLIALINAMANKSWTPQNFDQHIFSICLLMLCLASSNEPIKPELLPTIQDNAWKIFLLGTCTNRLFILHPAVQENMGDENSRKPQRQVKEALARFIKAWPDTEQGVASVDRLMQQMDAPLRDEVVRTAFAEQIWFANVLQRIRKP